MGFPAPPVCLGLDLHHVRQAEGIVPQAPLSVPVFAKALAVREFDQGSKSLLGRPVAHAHDLIPGEEVLRWKREPDQLEQIFPPSPATGFFAILAANAVLSPGFFRRSPKGRDAPKFDAAVSG